jgi:hypothetical protein
MFENCGVAVGEMVGVCFGRGVVTQFHITKDERVYGIITIIGNSCHLSISDNLHNSKW